MKSLLTIIGGAALGRVLGLTLAAIVALVIIPAGLAILAIEWQRANGWLGWRRAFLVRAASKHKPESLSR